MQAQKKALCNEGLSTSYKLYELFIHTIIKF